jgi:anaerobic ribonucleoside-triphosphate reductase activating protein
MLKFFDNAIVFKEVPNEISLAINITNCPLHCKGCHSPWLWDDVGEELTEEILLNLTKQSQGISCILFLGGDNSYSDVRKFAKFVKSLGLKFAWYSGRNIIPVSDLKYFDYIKIGQYEEALGGLDKITTNQRFFNFNKLIGNNSFNFY